MATFDLLAGVKHAAKIAVGNSGDEVLTLDPRGRYQLHNCGAKHVYFSTDGEAVAADDNSALGQGRVNTSITSSLLSTVELVGVGTLRLRCAGSDTSLVTVTRCGDWVQTV